MRKAIAAFALYFAVAGCTTPEIGVEIAALGEGGTAATDALKPELEALAEAEREALLDSAIADRDIVYRTTQGCALYANRVPGASASDCQILNETLDAPAPGSARRALAQLETLGAYSKALTALAESNSPTEIGTATTAAVAAIDDLSKTPPGAGLADYAARLADRQTAIQTVATRAALQAKYNALRRVVHSADPAVGTVLDAVVAYYDQSVGVKEQAAFNAMKRAEDRMRDMRRTGSVAQYRESVASFETAFTAYKAAVESSPVELVTGFRNAHAALERRLQSPDDTDEIVAYLKQLKEFSDALKEL